MLALFQRKQPSVAACQLLAPDTDLPKGLIRPETAASLLSTPRRQRLLEYIWQRTSMSRKQFDALYYTPLKRYAELVQKFPASESHHHAYPGGMLDHGLEIVAYGLKLRQSHLLPIGASPEDQAAQSEAWTAAVAYAALLHDIGKIAVDLHVELSDGSVWHPWHGSLRRPYRFHYREGREYRLHNAAAGLIYHQLLDRDILDWLSIYPALWAPLLYVLAGQNEHAGILGELVVQADRASVAQELGGDPARAMAAPKYALQRKLLDGLRYLLKEALKLNQSESSDGWLTEDSLWLVSKTVSDKLRAHLLSQGIDGIPVNNTALFNVLQDHGMLQPTIDGKAIWRANITSATGWSHSFTLLRVAPALIWEPSERPASFSGTVHIESAVTDRTHISESGAPSFLPDDAQEGIGETLDGAPVLSSSGDEVDALLEIVGLPETNALDVARTILSRGKESDQVAPSFAISTDENEVPAESEQPSGEHFMIWLNQGLLSRKLILNDTKALIHTVDNTLYLVSPGIFQRYAQEYVSVAMLAKQDNLSDWQWIQKRFEKLQCHRKQGNGLNIWTCEVRGPRKSRRIHGYLLATPQMLLTEVPPNNPYLVLV